MTHDKLRTQIERQEDMTPYQETVSGTWQSDKSIWFADNGTQTDGDPQEVTRDGEVRQTGGTGGQCKRSCPDDSCPYSYIIDTNVLIQCVSQQCGSPQRLATWQPRSHCMPVSRLLGHLTCDVRLIQARSQDNGRQFTATCHTHWRLSLNLMDCFN